MNRFLYTATVLLGVSLLVSCTKENISIKQLVGTWDYVKTEYHEEDGSVNEEIDDSIDYIVITEDAFTFYYKEGHHMSNHGEPYAFSYSHPHLYIAGFNKYDVVSLKNKQLILRQVIMSDGREWVVYRKR